MSALRGPAKTLDPGTAFAIDQGVAALEIAAMKPACTLLLSVFLVSAAPAQVTLHVPAQYATVGAAVAAANSLVDAGVPAPGDYVIIQVAAGTFVETSSINLGMRTHIVGAGANLTTIDGQTGTATYNLPVSGGPSPVVQGVTITGDGHLVYADGGGANFVDCIFTGGGTPLDVFGGSAGRLDFASVTYTRCTFTNCAGPRVLAGSPTYFELVGCEFVNNAGAGVRFWEAGIVSDCLFASNGGDAVSLPFDADLVTIRNSTFWGNAGAGISGAGAFNPVTVSDSILWGNTTQISGSANVSWSVVEGGWPGATNLASDPLLVDPANGDFSLAPGSPAIDSGDPAGDVDPDGSRVDRGYRPGLPFLPAAAIGSAHFPAVWANAPSSTLTVNMSDGGLDRRVNVAVGEAFTLAFSEPWPFMIGGYLSVPDFDDQVFLPSIGIACFPPCWPGLATPDSFTLTNSARPTDPCALLPSSPGPWSLTFPQGIGIPIQVTFQAWFLRTESFPPMPTVTYVRASNAILLNVY